MIIFAKLILFIPWFIIMGLLTAIYCPILFYLMDNYPGINVDRKFNSVKICYPWVWWNNLIFR